MNKNRFTMKSCLKFIYLKFKYLLFMINQKLEKLQIKIVLFSPLILLFIFANTLFYFLAIEPLIDLKNSQDAVYDLNQKMSLILSLQKEREQKLYFMLFSTREGTIKSSSFNELEINKFVKYVDEEKIKILKNFIKSNNNKNLDVYELYINFVNLIDQVLKDTKIYYVYKIKDLEIYRFLLAKTIFLIIIENAHREMYLSLINKNLKQLEHRKEIFSQFLDAIENQKVYTIGFGNISPSNIKESIEKIRVSKDIQEFREKNIQTKMEYNKKTLKEIYEIYSQRIQSLNDFYNWHNSFILQYLEMEQKYLLHRALIISLIGIFPFFLFLWSIIGVTKYYKKIEKLVYTDTLTELYNIRYFWEFLKNKINDLKSKNQISILALIIIDLDNFKEINDNYGHDIGDMVLKKIGNILSELKNNNIFSARYGGDEFLILVIDLQKEKVIEFAKELQKKIHSIVIKINDSEIKTYVSIGISFFPDNAKDHKELFKIADICLLKAKSLGKQRIYYLN